MHKVDTVIPSLVSEKRSTFFPVIILHNIDPRWTERETKQVLADVRTMREALSAEGHSVTDLPVTSPDIESLLRPYHPKDHIVLNWCEELPGQPKSEVEVAAFLEASGYIYTGSSPEVLALSYDKVAIKEILERHKVLTPEGRILSVTDAERWNRFPAIVKPAREHGSISLTPDSVVTSAAELHQQISRIERSYRQPALVEDFIEGRELHVTICGNDQIEVLPPVEMDFAAFGEVRRHLCTYDAKYSPGSEDFEKIELIVPAILDPATRKHIENTAITCYRAIGCRDYARIDMRLRGNDLYVLDVNPNADLSPDTSTALIAAHCGISYGRFVSFIVNLAARRHPVFGDRS